MITLENISKTYQTKDGTVEALKDVSLTIEKGDIFGIIGMSGAGIFWNAQHQELSQ